ncbi:hypothetical protein SAMN05444972_101121 [Marininema halotolerans]|uniref:Uncharacterized protein n=1 Tax=Marininema halotolerans TaxID=1155944 RepID=A0A1I6NTF7_9BACL|nr:hypothetical protein SAMN05444972_101121 [Marininema halotolerans]
MYYVILDSEKFPLSILHEDQYFEYYNPLKKDHRVEFRGSMNQCYTFVAKQNRLSLMN